MPSPAYQDLLSQASDALSAVLETDSALSAYNWQRWESDTAVAQPRGIVNASDNVALVYGDPPIHMLRMEVVLEGKPKKGLLSQPMAELFALIGSTNLPGLLQAQITDQSIQFRWRAEDISLAQTIEGDLRVRRCRFMLPCVWMLFYSP